MTDRTDETTRPKVRGLPPLPFAEGHAPGFRNNTNLFPAGTQLAWTPEHVAEYERCVADPEYFVENYVKIVHVDDGLVNFNLYPYQREILRTACANRYTLVLTPRQAGKTTAVVGILLWHILFNRRYAVAIVANKMAQARDEIMARLRLAYEWLPNWLQQGVVTWNKSFIELENGSKIRAAATTSGSLRGSSYNCVIGETVVTVRDVDTRVIEDVTIEDLHERLKSNSCKYVDGKNHESVLLSDREGEETSNLRATTGTSTEYEILTEMGFKKFDGIKKTFNRPTVSVETDIGKKIYCTPDHEFITAAGRVPAMSMLGKYVMVRDGSEEKVIAVGEFENRDTYDPINVVDTHSFFADGILVSQCIYLDEFSHIHRNQQEDFFTSVVPTIASGRNTKIVITTTPRGLDYFYKLWTESEKGKNEYKRVEVKWDDPPGRDAAWREARLGEMSVDKFAQEYEAVFLGSSGTLINGRVLARLPVDYPVQTTSWGVNVYDHPEAGRSYALVCDVSRGVALDYSAFAVFDVTELPYRVVATYRSNTVPNLSLADTLVDVARHFNEAIVLVESCDIGQAVVEHALYEHGYENTLTTNVGSKKGTVLGHGFGASSRLGVKTNKQVKRMGCFALKTLVENDKLLLRDATVISELSTFVAKGASWEAEPGCNDDLAMCCVLFGWLSVQPAFKEERNHDLRAAIARHAASRGEYDFTEFVGTVVDGSGEASGPRIVNGVTQTPPEYGDHEDYYASRDWGGMGVNDLTRSFRK